jgi:hypothetical protein
VDAQERESRLADAMADFHRRRALGESPDPEEYRGALEEAHEEFREILAASAALQDVVEPFTAPALPQRFGRYMLVRRLGQGAMGVVFEGLDEQLGRPVAVKVLRTGLDLDGTAFERFRREARACSQVRHPSIVTVHDAGAHDGRLYYTMDVAAGASLAARIASGDLPSLPALLGGFADVADALHALHSHQPDAIIHRDVKPSNVIVQDDGRMVLADFGLARTAASETLTRTGDALGTPLYMSPEQTLEGHAEVDARSDVYGLGATIYEALTGRPPYTCPNTHELMMRIRSEQRPPSPSDVAPEVPRGLSAVVLKALEKRKEDRYQTAAAMRDDLRRVAQGLPPDHGPVTRLQRGGRWVLRRAPVLALLLAVLLGGTWLWSNRKGNVVFQAVGGFGVRVSPGAHLVSLADLVALPPGPYTATLVVAPGDEKDLVPHETPFDVRAGETSLVPLRFEKVTERGLQRYLERAESEMPRIQVGTARRGAGRDFAWPLNAVRLEDLDEFAVALDYGSDVGAPLVVRFESGGGVLGEVAFTPEEEFHRGAIPAGVRERLRVGDHVRMSLRASPRGEILKATFEVVDRPDVGARVAAVLDQVGAVDAATRAEVEGRFLLADGLAGPALRAIHGIPVGDRGPAAWGVLASAAERLNVDAGAIVEDAWNRLDQIRKSDPATWHRLFQEE